MTSDFEALLARLVTGKVEFVLVGGYSAMLHGSSMMTRDVDIVCPMTTENLHALFRSLSDANPVHRMTSKPEAFTAAQIEKSAFKNLYLRTDRGILDCLGEVLGLGDYSACRERSIAIDLGKFSINTLTIDALIEAKIAMGRPRDLQTAEELTLIRRRLEQN